MPGIGLVAIESAGSSAPYFCAIDARIVIALIPFVVDGAFAGSSNHRLTEAGSVVLDHGPLRVHRELEPLTHELVAILDGQPLGDFAECSQFCGQSFSASRPTSLNCLALR